MKNFEGLLEQIKSCSKKKLAVAVAQDDAVLEAVKAAKDKDIADAILVGDADKIKEIAERHNCEPDTIVYAWIMYHPVQAMPIVGSRKVERIESAVKAMDVKLEHYEWYEIYAASGQQQIR